MSETNSQGSATRFHRRELLIAGVGVLASSGSSGFAHGAGSSSADPVTEPSVRLLLKSISISRTTTIVAACRLENHSDHHLTFQLNYWETAFESGMRFWRVKSDEVFAFAPNYPPGIPTRPPPTILTPGAGIDFEFRPLVSSPGFMRRDQAGGFDYTRPVALPRWSRYAVDTVARVRVCTGDRVEQHFTVSSWNKVWFST